MELFARISSWPNASEAVALATRPRSESFMLGLARGISDLGKRAITQQQYIQSFYRKG